MKTIAIPTYGWNEDEHDIFEQYVSDIADDFQVNVSLALTTDHHYDIELDENHIAVEYLILHATGSDLQGFFDLPIDNYDYG